MLQATIIKGSYIDTKTTFSQQIIYTTFASILLAISANISIPVYPVPFTFQSMLVILIGAMLGKKLGLIAVLQTIGLGFLGFPVFANFSNSYVALMSPSLGYILGFIVSVYIAGWAAEKGLDRKIVSAIIVFSIAHQTIFVFGVGYLSWYLGSLNKGILFGYVPFMGWDIVKFVSASIIMCSLWKLKITCKN